MKTRDKAEAAAKEMRSAFYQGHLNDAQRWAATYARQVGDDTDRPFEDLWDRAACTYGWNRATDTRGQRKARDDGRSEQGRRR